MNEIGNKILLIGDKYMPEVNLKKPGFTYSACRPFTKNKERINKFKETGDANYIYKNELNKACFQHDIAKNPKYDEYQRGGASMVHTFLDKKLTDVDDDNNNNNKTEQ